MRYFKSKNKAGSIAIIGGVDGPTAEYMSNSEENDNKWNQLLKACKEIIEPEENKTTVEELKKYLIDEYDAIEIEMSENKKKALKYTVIMNYYPEALEQLQVLETKEDRDYFDDFNNIELIPDEKYHLDFSAFKVPRTSKTEKYYQEFEKEINEHTYKSSSLFPRLFSKIFSKRLKKLYENIENTTIEIELSTGYMQINNGARSLANKIVLWQGITQEDIDNCTTDFISYASAMRDMGEIVYCDKEGKWDKK